MEILDIYNEKKEKSNKTFIRGEKLKDGEYYLIVEIWTVNEDGKILVTLRDPSKKSEPNKWENTGGAVKAGESSKKAAIRELFEETGIKADQEELIFLGTSHESKLFADIYFLRKNISLSDIVLLQGETISAKLVSYKQLYEMIENGEFAATIANRLISVLDKFLDLYGCI